METKKCIALCGMACHLVQMQRLKARWEEDGKTVILAEPFDFLQHLGKDKASVQKWEAAEGSG